MLSPLGYWRVLVLPQLLRGTATKRVAWTITKLWETAKSSGQADRGDLSPMQDHSVKTERGDCFTWCEQTATESRKIKKQWNMFQTKEQDKTPEIDFNEMQISDLPNGIHNNGYKDSHQSQENNAWTKQKFLQRYRKYKKVTNRNHRVGEYNNWTAKFNRRV